MRIMLGCIVCAVVALAALPVFLAPIASERICSEINRRFGLVARIDELSLSWKGEVDVNGLHVAREDGEPVVDLHWMRVAIPLRQLLLGSTRTLTEAEGLVLTVREDERGVWDFEDWLATFERTGVPKGVDTSAHEPRAPSTWLLSLGNSRVRIERQNGVTTEAELSMATVGSSLGFVNAGFAAAEPTADPDALDIHGSATISLQDLVTDWVDVAGEVELSMLWGASTWEADLAANEGQVKVGGSVDLRALLDPQSSHLATLAIDATDVAITSKLSSMASVVHPAFLAVEGSSIIGTVDCEMDLTYGGPLDADIFSRDSVQGSGRFQLGEVRLQSTPTLQQMLSFLDVDPRSEIRVQPVTFTIRGGRLTYDEVWEWSIDGITTRFDGSVGFDRSLDLVWSLPITDAVAERVPILAIALGETVRLPIRGTTDAPEFDWRGALQEISASAGAGDIVGDIAGLLEGIIDDEPATLFERAGELWDSGQRAEAAVLYRRIRDEHEKSLVYLLNRRRIKRRGQHGE